MPRPFDPAQLAQNARFIDALRATGNARLAARSLGVHRSTYTKRRARCAAFATRWDAALAAAHAAFHLAGGARVPEAPGAGGARPARRGAAAAAPFPQARLRTKGGEPTIVRRAGGRLQLRLARAGRINAEAEQAFLAALSATANVRLSAAAAGFAHSSFYRRRQRDAAFAREYRLALKMGWERLECAMLSAGLAGSGAHDRWRRNDPPSVPPLSADQALQLLCLHQKSVELGWDKPHRRRRRGESDETYNARLRAMWAHEQRIEAEDGALRRATHYEETGRWRLPGEPDPLPLPPLHFVTGWSKASGRAPFHPGVALFGGWRIADMRRKMGKG